MKIFLLAASVVTALSSAPVLAQTASAESLPSMTILDTAERAEMQNRYRNSESETERTKVRAEIQERVRAQGMLNREISVGHRNQLTVQEQRQVRDQLQSAQSDHARQDIIAEAQTLAQNRIQAWTQNTRRFQNQEHLSARANAQGFGAPRWGNSGTSSSTRRGSSGGAGFGGRR